MGFQPNVEQIDSARLRFLVRSAKNVAKMLKLEKTCSFGSI